jgi:hypothetical protein
MLTTVEPVLQANLGKAIRGSRRAGHVARSATQGAFSLRTVHAESVEPISASEVVASAECIYMYNRSSARARIDQVPDRAGDRVQASPSRTSSQSGMTRFVVGSVLLALVELIGFATYTATHRIEVGVVAVRPDWGGSCGSSVLIRAPVSRSRSWVPRTHSTSALRDNGARANLNASVRAIKHADPPFFEGSLAWESSPSLPGGGALIAASTELHGRPGPVQDYLVLGDPVMGWAVRPFLPAGAGCTTLDLDIRYVKPITVATGTIVASGTVPHHGRRTAPAEGRLGAADTGALLAHSPSPLLVRS